jgi:PKHD-type hydroxylase
VIKSGFGRHTFKLPAGHLVTYPTYHLHEVTPVTRGERVVVVVSWMQSMTRDPLKRELPLDLALLGQSLTAPAKNASRGDLDLLDRVRKNLLRMWAEN